MPEWQFENAGDLGRSCQEVAAVLNLPRRSGESVAAWRDRLIGTGQIVDIRGRVIVARALGTQHEP